MDEATCLSWKKEAEYLRKRAEYLERQLVEQHQLTYRLCSHLQHLAGQKEPVDALRDVAAKMGYVLVKEGENK